MHARTPPPSLRPLAVALAALWAVGCATPVRRPIVYPPPPDKPRIELVRSFKMPSDVRTSFLQKLWAAIVPYRPDTLIANPAGVALSPDDRLLFVALPKSHRLIRVDLESGEFRTIGAGGDRPLRVPAGVATDADGNLYVADKGQSAVVVYDRNYEVVNLIGRDRLKYPNALAIDRKARLLYVINDAVTQEGRHTVETFSLKGDHIRTLGGGKGGAEGLFVFPGGLAVSPTGDLFVADTLNFRVQVFDRDGRFLRKFGESGHNGPGLFDKIHGIAFDTFGNIYVADSLQGVQILNQDAQGLMGFGGGALDIPMYLAIDHRDHIFVSDLTHGIVEFKLVNTTAEDSRASTGRPPDATPAPKESGAR